MSRHANSKRQKQHMYGAHFTFLRKGKMSVFYSLDKMGYGMSNQERKIAKNKKKHIHKFEVLR